MSDRIPDLQQLRYVLAAAEHGSFRRAAVMLNVEESTISRNVRRVEELIGGIIFERSHAGVRLTAAGERFLGDMQSGVEQLRQATERVAVSAGSGNLTIGMSIPLNCGTAADVLAGFRARHGAIAVEFVEDAAITNIAGVRRRQIDLALVAGYQQPGGCETLRLRDEVLLAAFPLEHPLGRRSSVRWEELGGERFIVSSEGAGLEIRDRIVARFASLSEPPDIGVHRVCQSGLLSLVASGYGVTITSGIDGSHQLERIAVVRIENDEPVPRSAIWLASNLNPALPKLVAVARQVANRGLSSELG